MRTTLRIQSLSVVVLLAGCAGTNALVDVVPVPPGTGCEYGGVRVLSGQDTDRDGRLAASEVSGSEFVCNQRVDGKTSLVAVKPELPGAHCETGGQRLEFGLDDNNDYTLQAAEIDDTQYVCNGRAHLLRVDDVSAGAVCPAGGTRVQTGFDSNANNVLDGNEVQSTRYVCNGEAGKSTLVSFSAIAADPTGVCFFGGTRIDSGLDVDGDGVLDANEILSTRNVCAVQVNAFMTLVKNSAILPGQVCEYGGVSIEVGIDDNDDHVLQPAEVDSTTAQCSSVLIVDGLTTLVDTVSATAAQCPFGGVVMRSGLDDDRDGTLESAEFDQVRVICNGANGYDGVTRTDPYTGAQCASGSGFKVQSGLDLNRNGVLDAAEVHDTSYVCNGATGQSGADALVRTSDAGSVCGAYGGVKVQSGSDDNRNGALDTAEIDATAYVCNGYDGYTSLVAMYDAGNACGPTGGVRIDVGLDTNDDLALQSSEVTQYAYVCNGYDGYNAAVATDENYWSACGGNWGLRVLSGLDLDGDGYLDGDEVQYENYVC